MPVGRLSGSVFGWCIGVALTEGWRMDWSVIRLLVAYWMCLLPDCMHTIQSYLVCLSLGSASLGVPVACRPRLVGAPVTRPALLAWCASRLAGLAAICVARRQPCYPAFPKP
eukprot:365791-Chlamydomonas_euryale.AAC.5